MAKPTTQYSLVKLPCKRYSAKFVSTEFGTVINANRSTALGQFMSICLSKNYYDTRHRNNIDQYPSHILVKINKWQFENIGFDFTPDKVLAINSFIENLLISKLHEYCNLRINQQLRRAGYDKCIEQFAAHYQIDLYTDKEDISFDGLKKKLYRYRKQIEQEQKPLNIFSAHSSSQIRLSAYN